MAGYNWNQGMSNNAVAAYEDGLCPASQIAGIPAALTQKHCRYAEWHHSSKAFNVVNFYNPAYVRATFGLEVNEEFEANPAAVADLSAYRKAGVERFDNCRVEWIEWTGSLNRPVANPKTAEGCTVEVKKQTATITFPSGATMTKRLTTKHFAFRQVQA